MVVRLDYYNLQFDRKNIKTMFQRQMFFFLHSEEFLHDEMGSCYTSYRILHLWK